MSRCFSEQFLAETISIIQAIDALSIESCATGLATVRDQGGRLFILGVGGSAGHASHAVNDFRKICNFEAYAPTDNVSELTARTNDDGWDTVFVEWLRTSRLTGRDAVLVFSVGGGDSIRDISANLVAALSYASEVGSPIFGIIGRDGGFTATKATAWIHIPPLVPGRITPHTEGICAVIWHLLATHPRLSATNTKWESVAVSPGAKTPSG